MSLRGILLLIALYFLPTIVANFRGHPGPACGFGCERVKNALRDVFGPHRAAPLLVGGFVRFSTSQKLLGRTVGASRTGSVNGPPGGGAGVESVLVEHDRDEPEVDFPDQAVERGFVA